MRVAVCFWGLCRSTDLVIDSIKQYIFQPLLDVGIEVDTFLHTYTLYRPYSNSRAGEERIQLKNTVWKLLEPTKYIIENQDKVDTHLQFEQYRTYGNPWAADDAGGFQTLDNHIRALWSLKQVTTLWIQSGISYDAVLYVRPDCRYLRPLQPSWLYSLKKYTIMLPDFHLHENCNDRFAIGVPDVMRHYGMRFDGALEYSKRLPLHSERYLSFILSRNAITIEHIPFRFWRMRANGETCPADADL
jgi:hypothetical protein